MPLFVCVLTGRMGPCYTRTHRRRKCGLMPSERVQRQINRLLDEAEEASVQENWELVLRRAKHALTFDPDNADAKDFLAAAERALGEPKSEVSAPQVTPTPQSETPVARTDDPRSFANGRYQVKEFLGEGGKKRVYKAHDSVLDRDVALAVIKTEGLDATSRVRITREAQAMGRLGDHPHVLQIFDLADQGTDLTIADAHVVYKRL